jgi:multidrug efflux pump subunit AcrB
MITRRLGKSKSPMKGKYTIILLFTVLCLLGLLAIHKVPLRFIRNNQTKNLVISYGWPNAAPEAMERQVTAPLEGILGTLQGAKEIESSSGYNEGNIKLSLDEKTDVNKARFEVASLIRQIYRSLPQGVTYPTIHLNDSDDQWSTVPLISLQLNGIDSPGRLRKYIEVFISPRLAQLDGISSVEIHGGESEETLVNYNQNIADGLEILEQDIVTAIKQNRLQGNLGWITQKNGTRQSISLSPHSSDLNFNRMPILKSDGRIVKLGDITTVKTRESRMLNYFRINGQSAIQIELMAKAGVNQLEIAFEVHKLLEKIVHELPTGYGIRTDYDVTYGIQESLQKAKLQAGIILILIFILTTLIFRNWRVLLITAVGIIANSLITVLVFFVFKVELQLFSITVFILSTDLLVVTHLLHTATTDFVTTEKL